MKMGIHSLNFRDFSIKKKMIVTLILCVLLPFIIAAVIVSSVLARKARKEIQKEEQYIINELRQELEAHLKRANEFAEAHRYSGIIRNILMDKSSMNDYILLHDIFKDFVDREELCRAVYLVRDDQILFQIGETYQEQEVSLSTGTDYEIRGNWTGVDTVKVFDVGFNKSVEVVSCVYNIYDFYQYKKIGKLVISYRVDQLKEKFVNRFSEYVEYNALFAPNGDRIAEGQLEEETLLDYDSIPLDQTEGYRSIRTRSQKGTLFFSRTAEGFTLLRVVMDQKDSALLAYLLLAVLVCGIFGVTYMKVLDVYVTGPLAALSRQMSRTRPGERNRFAGAPNRDEIGDIILAYENMVDDLNHLINQVYVEKIHTQEAEKNALLAQLKPHFLYNTLDSIRWCALKNNDPDTARQLEALSEIYRNVLHFGQEMIEIAEEKSFLKNYFYLMKVRSSIPMELFIRIEEELDHAYIPKLCIQPLVENAIHHGLENSENGGIIDVRIRKRSIEKEEYLEIRVFDNGVGTNAGAVRRAIADETLKDAFALRSISKRIRLKYGERCRLFFYSKKGAGTLVMIRLKYVRQGEGYENDDC